MSRRTLKPVTPEDRQQVLDALGGGMLTYRGVVRMTELGRPMARRALQSCQSRGLVVMHRMQRPHPSRLRLPRRPMSVFRLVEPVRPGVGTSINWHAASGGAVVSD